jgi:hypothetical protein
VVWPTCRRQLFLATSEWTFGSLLFAGSWDKRLGVLGALGSTGTFIATVTIIPFMPDGWDAAAGGFPAMTGNVPFLIEGCRSARCLVLPPEAGRSSPDAAIRWHPADGDYALIRAGMQPLGEARH